MSDEKHNVEHTITTIFPPDGSMQPWPVSCTCGAKWIIPYSSDIAWMPTELQRTSAAHRAYAKRLATRVD